MGIRNHVAVYPASHYVTTRENLELAIDGISEELSDRVKWFNANNKLLEAQRIDQRTRYDIEMLKEIGRCKGIENYSRHINRLKGGERP